MAKQDFWDWGYTTTSTDNSTLKSSLKKYVCADGTTNLYTRSDNSDWQKISTLTDDYIYNDYKYNDYLNTTATLTFKEIVEKAENNNNNNNKKDEDNTMNNNTIFKNFDFGPCSGDTVHMSMYGIAIKNAAGGWVSYDVKNNTIMDVDILNFNASKFLYKMPVAIKNINVGDVVIHMKKPMFVKSSNYLAKTLTVVDIYNGETKDIMLTRSPFGFDFATKVVSLVDFNGLSADADNPFGSNPMMLALMMGDGNLSTDSLLPLMLMGNGGFNMNDPMMMYFLMSGNKGGDNLLPLFLMMNNKGSCSCGCGCHDNCDEVGDNPDTDEYACECVSPRAKAKRK